MKKIILDCDPGMDDSIAIMMLSTSDDIELLGVCAVNGNYPVDVTTDNALKILELVGRADIPVFKGMANPMVRRRAADPFTHGSDGLAESGLPSPKRKAEAEHAVNAIRRLILENPGEVAIVCTGPMSNIGMAISMYSEIIPEIKEIVAISGAFGLNEASFLNATGDTPQSEWNVYVDPEAARLVYESGIPVRLIGLDIATAFQVDFTPSDLDILRACGSPKASFLLNAIAFVNGRGFGAYCTVIDAMAAASVMVPGIVRFAEARIGVDTRDGLTLGMTVRDGRHHFVWNNLPCVEIAVEADYRRFLDLVIEYASRPIREH